MPMNATKHSRSDMVGLTLQAHGPGCSKMPPLSMPV